MFAEIRERRGSFGDKPPFHLSFAKEQLLGTSDVRPLKIDGSVASKRFYASEAEDAMGRFDMEETLFVPEGDHHTARELYRWSLLSSHAYGWWYEKGIRPRDSCQLGFHKRTSEMVNLQTKINEQDRKQRGLDDY